MSPLETDRASSSHLVSSCAAMTASTARLSPQSIAGASSPGGF